MSSTVTDSGMFTVFEIAPEMNGWTAPIILMWPMCDIARDVVRRRLVLAHDVVVRLAVLRVALVRAHDRSDLSRLAVGPAGHQCGDGGCRGAALGGVVRQAVRHQQRPEVRVAEAEL